MLGYKVFSCAPSLDAVAGTSEVHHLAQTGDLALGCIESDGRLCGDVVELAAELLTCFLRPAVHRLADSICYCLLSSLHVLHAVACQLACLLL